MTIKVLILVTCDECGKQLQSEKGELDGLLKREEWLTVHWAEAEARGLRKDGLNSHYCYRCRAAMEKKMPGLGTA
jgi:hypothetical protein